MSNLTTAAATVAVPPAACNGRSHALTHTATNRGTLDYAQSGTVPFRDTRGLNGLRLVQNQGGHDRCCALPNAATGTITRDYGGVS
jgi:hypothetical protein